MEIRKWFLSLILSLSNNAGKVEEADEEETEEEEIEAIGDDDETEEEDEEDSDDEDEEEESEEEDESDADGDGGNNSGKKRSNMIPRERFDKVNAKAKQVERLIELGVIVEGEDGELHLNQEEASKGKEKKSESEAEGDGEFYLTQDEVDEGSWPLAQKINKGFKHYETMANKLGYALVRLQSENAVLRDYPEYLQKGSPLRKRAMEIMKNDPEFKKTYRGNPEAGYWAVKRAAELLAGKASPMPKKKVKSKFIIGKGDKSSGPKKVVDIEKMTKQQLDDLERKEHLRFNGNKRK